MTPPPATTTSVVTANERSLRRHYPDQVRRSEALGLPLSPPGLPWPELFPAVHPISAWRGAKGARRRPRRGRAMMEPHNEGGGRDDGDLGGPGAGGAAFLVHRSPPVLR